MDFSPPSPQTPNVTSFRDPALEPACRPMIPCIVFVIISRLDGAQVSLTSRFGYSLSYKKPVGPRVARTVQGCPTEEQLPFFSPRTKSLSILKLRINERPRSNHKPK